MNYNNLKFLNLSLGILFFIIAIIGFLPLDTGKVLAQGQDSYEHTEDGMNIPNYEESESFPENENPDPEFMEETEPGEYDQSDDVTEMNDDNY